MNEQPVVVYGVVRSDGTLELNDKVPLPAGHVSVTIQPVPYSQENDPFFIMLRRIWAIREAAGLLPRSREEIDAELQEVHDEFNEGVEAAGRLQEECRRARESAGKQEKEMPRSSAWTRTSSST